MHTGDHLINPFRIWLQISQLQVVSDDDERVDTCPDSSLFSSSHEHAGATRMKKCEYDRKWKRYNDWLNEPRHPTDTRYLHNFNHENVLKEVNDLKELYTECLKLGCPSVIHKIKSQKSTLGYLDEKWSITEIIKKKKKYKTKQLKSVPLLKFITSYSFFKTNMRRSVYRTFCHPDLTNSEKVETNRDRLSMEQTIQFEYAINNLFDNIRVSAV